jgi:hypothetical protein
MSPNARVIPAPLVQIIRLLQRAWAVSVQAWSAETAPLLLPQAENSTRATPAVSLAIAPPFVEQPGTHHLITPERRIR